MVVNYNFEVTQRSWGIEVHIYRLLAVFSLFNLVHCTTGPSKASSTNHLEKTSPSHLPSSRTRAPYETRVRQAALGASAEVLSANPGSVFWGIVQPPKLNVRSGPGPQHKVVGTVNQGWTLAFNNVESGWVHIGAGKWVAGAYLKLIHQP